MPDLTLEEADRCYVCDGILYGDGPCVHCGVAPDAPLARWNRAVSDEDPDNFQGTRDEEKF